MQPDRRTLEKEVAHWMEGFAGFLNDLGVRPEEARWAFDGAPLWHHEANRQHIEAHLPEEDEPPTWRADDEGGLSLIHEDDSGMQRVLARIWHDHARGWQSSQGAT